MKDDGLSPINPAVTADQNDHEHATSYRWLAHELHDGLLQWVVGARMQVEAAAAKLGEDSEATGNLKQAIAHLLNALSEGRELIGFLENQELSDCDAVVAIENFIESMQALATQRGQKLTFERPDPDWPSISKQHAWSILRFVQQAVQNAIQHAGPASVSVRLGWGSTSSEAVVVAAVHDDGRGFDATVEPPAGHFGLQSLQQRANMCGGRFAIETAPGAGCRVELEIPAASASATV